MSGTILVGDDWHHDAQPINGVTVTDLHEEFGWLSEFGPFSDVSCVSFVRSLSPVEALTRLGAEVGGIEEATFEELQERTMKCVDSNDMRTSYVGTLEMDGWTVLIQLWWASIAVDRHLLMRLSQATEVVSINRNIHASDFFVYAADGELVTWFDLLGPDARAGSDPDRLVDMMREVGLDPDLDPDLDLDLDVDVDDPDLGTEFPRSFALARKITGFPFSQDMLDMRFLGAMINSR
ncbi:hypothetical protein Aple_084250 [Acrocarpospora pleiomorpha]|uniref:Uncharacterized protein n=1 Tax=Acrocarpospora pleiomorpha TaxID=90975 RepID=A0A5M3XX68_9ACTN|nr:DUF6461 domain-containing protein [Acrocarpospora pleiomorpha]GES25526.1 hypothetical protein Aple_084250 [Acrocarpospora pleiomorpha]